MKKIIEPGKNCWKVIRAESAGILIDGLDYYRAFYKAASAARKTILISGWQFDSEVRLLRGEEEQSNGGDSRLLPFLDSLCEKDPELQIYILAWDFSLFFIPDHELVQEVIFNWATSERLRFIFDRTHAAGASHHQKLIVIDCDLAFIGGLDICSSHWDDREHAAVNPHRKDADGAYYEPYHDAVSWVKGEDVITLAEYFKERWTTAGGEDFELSCRSVPELFFEGGLTMPPGKVALSRTQAKTLDPPREQVLEIRQLYMDAISAAEKFIYIENQYFTSKEIYEAVAARMRDTSRPGLQVIIILPRMFNAFLEEISLGLAQTKMLTLLSGTAAQCGVKLGIYYSSASPEIFTYIHSKIMVVDDKFMTVGSANTSNRSMSLDTELNVTWEAAGRPASDEGNLALREAIRRIRTDLLVEHTGVTGKPEAARLYEEDEIAELLNTFADSGLYRLHCHAMETLFDRRWIKEIWAQDMLSVNRLAFDPAEPIVDQELWESIFSRRGGIISGASGQFPEAAPHGWHGRLQLFRRLHLEWLGLLALLALCGLLLWLLLK